MDREWAISSVRVRDPPTPPAPGPPGPLSYQGSIVTSHTYGGTEGARKFFFFIPNLPNPTLTLTATPTLTLLRTVHLNLSLTLTLARIEYWDRAGGGRNIVEETLTTNEVHTGK